MHYLAVLAIIFLLSCNSKHVQFKNPATQGFQRLAGSGFYDSARSMNWKNREALAAIQLRNGNMPGFFFRFVAIHTSVTDSATGRKIKARYFVSPDYISIGKDEDWARIPLTPMLAQLIAEDLNCFLPTKKLVDEIYAKAKVKLAPVPMYAFRDSSPVMYQHNLIIEGQRRGKKGLIAGIKKDLVISEKLARTVKPNREAIYGWHQLNGKPIQPLYTGHINWWVDYSHGARLVYRIIRVAGKDMDYTDVMKDPRLRRLLCDESFCDVTRYSFPENPGR